MSTARYFQLKRLLDLLGLKFLSITNWNDSYFKFIENDLIKTNKLTPIEAEYIIKEFKKNNYAYSQLTKINNDKNLNIAINTWTKLINKKEEEYSESWQKLIKWMNSCQVFSNENKTEYTEEFLKRFFIIAYCMEEWDKHFEGGL